MLNYNALQAEITLDYHERTSLSSIRILFSTLSSILAALLPLEIVKRFADVRAGYIAMGLVFGALFALPFIATVVAVRERREFQKPPERLNLAATAPAAVPRAHLRLCAADVPVCVRRHGCGQQHRDLLHEVLPGPRERGQLRGRHAARLPGAFAAALRGAEPAHQQAPRLHDRRDHVDRRDVRQLPDHARQPLAPGLRLRGPGRPGHGGHRGDDLRHLPRHPRRGRACSRDSAARASTAR